MNTDLKTDVLYEYDTNTNKNIPILIKECKQYKLDRFKLRTNIIESIKDSNIAIPYYHIIISYYNQYHDRSTIIKKHRFIRNQLEEIFNPRYRNQSDKSSTFCFCERHKTKLTGGSEELVKDTITNRLEYDDVNKDIGLGSYHSHILKSEIPDSIIFNATGKAKKLIKEVLDYDNVEPDISKIALQDIKKKLLKGICNRCDGIGNSNSSVKCVVSDDRYYYDGFIGWEGFIAYTTKQCYNAFQMMDVIDSDNSSLSLFPNRIPIKDAQNKQIYREQNE
jgi:hypothetical protein